MSSHGAGRQPEGSHEPLPSAAAAPAPDSPRPGWYQEPLEPQGRLRWWDGARWTDHRCQAPVPASRLRAGAFKPTKLWHWAALAGAALVGLAYVGLQIVLAILGN